MNPWEKRALLVTLTSIERRALRAAWKVHSRGVSDHWAQRLTVAQARTIPTRSGQCEIASGPLLRGTAEICIPRNLFASRVHPVAVDLVALFDDLVRLETDLWNRVDARVQQTHGFPLAWMEVMHLVSTTSGCRVLDVAEALFITVGGASKVVDKVEGAGWCRRLPNPNDGRSNLLELTASGRRVLQAGRLTFGEVLEVYLGAAAPAAELTQLSSTLGRMRRHLIVADQAAGPVSW